MKFTDLFRNKNNDENINVRAVEDINEQDCGGFALTYYKNYKNYSSTTLSSVFAAVELISNSIAQLPIHIRDNNGDIIPDHYLMNVFNGNIQSKFIMIKQLVHDMLIHGNGIAYIKRDNTGDPIGLIYCPNGSYSINYNDTTGDLFYLIGKISNKKIKPTDVIHILKNSNDGINGKGLKFFAQRTIENANNAEDVANGYFESGCSQTGILKSQKHLTKKQRSEIQEAWHTAHNGSSSNNIPVLPVDLDYIPLSSNASEAQLLESRLYSVQEIARYFNINPVLLGDLSHSSYSTIEAAQAEYLIHTLTPYIELIQDELNRKLCYGKDFHIDLDEDHILIADKNATSNYLQKLTAAGIISINEARHYLGLQPIENGDSHIIPYTNIQQNTVENNGKNQNFADK